jgi:hypothetical protein
VITGSWSLLPFLLHSFLSCFRLALFSLDRSPTHTHRIPLRPTDRLTDRPNPKPKPKPKPKPAKKKTKKTGKLGAVDEALKNVTDALEARFFFLILFFSKAKEPNTKRPLLVGF